MSHTFCPHMFEYNYMLMHLYTHLYIRKLMHLHMYAALTDVAGIIASVKLFLAW